MFFTLRRIRNPFKSLGVVFMTGLLAACQASLPGGDLGAGQRVSGQTVQVAMLLPMTSAQGGDGALARSLENAARLAASELTGATVEISVYDTGGQAAQAASMAQQAVSDGADVIIGPLRSDAAAAAGVAIANSNVNVLSFSNNTEIAGGNVFVLGHTFQNSAARMMSYAASQGRNQVVLVHADSLAGQVARDAVLSAARSGSANVVNTISYEFSQTGVINSIPQIVETVRQTGANSVMLTSDATGALPFFAQLLPENGLDTEAVRVMGLARWDAPPQTLEFPGLQGGWFPLPDPAATADFNARYQATYGSFAHVLAPLGYDAIRAVVDTAAATGRLGASEFTSSPGFEGANGVFVLRRDGTNARALAIAQIINNQVAVIDPAPRRLGGFGF